MKEQILYRADLLACQKQTLELQAELLQLSLNHNELSPVREVILKTSEEMAEIAREYGRMLLRPMSLSKINYYKVMRTLYETQR